MADVHKLIDTILSDPRLTNSRAFSGKMYEDEPILCTGSQMKNYLPQRYRDMKALARPVHDGFEYRRPSETELFVMQARFMEEWEDDFPFSGSFERYYPTYSMMNDSQLRGYFSWRTRVRHGQVEKTSLSFAFVYIYELINCVGASTPNECFDLLYNFWVKYRELDPEIDRYVKSWLRDFVIYHNLLPALIERFEDTSFEQALIVVRCAEGVAGTAAQNTFSKEELFKALCRLSSYRIEKSRFAQEYPEDIRQVACDCYFALCLHCAKRRKKGLIDSWFGSRSVSSHVMFPAAVFCEPGPHSDCLYRVNDAHAYSCRNGRWSGLRNYRTAARNVELGAMFATVDRLMRLSVGYGHPLKEYELPKYLHKIVDASVSSWSASRQEAERRRVSIDRAQLAGIRSRSAVTREQLLIEEERLEDAQLVEEGQFILDRSDHCLEQNEPFEDSALGDPAVADSCKAEIDPPAESASVSASDVVKTKPMSELPYGLSPIEFSYLRAMIADNADAARLSEVDSQDLIIDSINEKLFELLGDIAIEFIEGEPKLIEDYRDDLKGALDL